MMRSALTIRGGSAHKPAKTEIDVPKAKAVPNKGGADETSGGMRTAKYRVGDVVKHRIYPFRGIIFDIDPVFNSTEEWWQSIPEEIRPTKNQPFYHLLAENDKTEYIAYVSEQNLLPDESGKPLRHPQVSQMFVETDGAYHPNFINAH
jgi:heat shock protein HspQ